MAPFLLLGKPDLARYLHRVGGGDLEGVASRQMAAMTPLCNSRSGGRRALPGSSFCSTQQRHTVCRLFPEPLPLWIGSYLANKTNCVNINLLHLSSRKAMEGVPLAAPNIYSPEC